MAYRQWHTAAQPAERTFFQGVQQVLKKDGVNDISLGLCLMQELLSPHRAQPAGEALATALMGSKLKQMLQVSDHRVTFGNADDGGMAQKEALLGKGFKIYA